jgi:hypothetical protein
MQQVGVRKNTILSSEEGEEVGVLKLNLNAVIMTDDDCLVVNVGATSGRSLFFTEKPHNFSLLASPIAHRRRNADDGTLNTTLPSSSSFDVKLTSRFEEQPEQVSGISHLISPEKENGVSAPSVAIRTNVDIFSCDQLPENGREDDLLLLRVLSLEKIVHRLTSRVLSLEKIIHRIENNKQDKADDYSGISSVSDDFPIVVGPSKRTPRGLSWFWRTRERPARRRVEV